MYELFICTNIPSTDGHATATAPSMGWDGEARDLEVYFGTSFIANGREATRPIPTPVASSTSQPTNVLKGKGSNAGAIAGGTIGGLVGLAAIIALVFFCLRRRKRKGVNQQPGKTESPSSISPDVTGMAQNPYMNRSPVSPDTGTLNSAIMHPLPYSPQSSPPPPSTPWYEITHCNSLSS